jgi:malonyl CoA-acyl carrier protein transacylase
MESQLGCLYRCTASEEISIEALQASLPDGLYLSVYQTPKHFLIASSGAGAEEWLKARGYRYSVLAQIPLHSPLMASILPAMESTIQASSIRSPKSRVFSSLWHQEMDCPHNCAKEAGANIVECVDWVKTLESLANDLKVEEIVSVGPAPTLLRFAERAPTARSFRMRDAYAQLTSEMSHVV